MVRFCCQFVFRGRPYSISWLSDGFTLRQMVLFPPSLRKKQDTGIGDALRFADHYGSMNPENNSEKINKIMKIIIDNKC